jgi:hypothetical protein
MDGTVLATRGPRFGNDPGTWTLDGYRADLNGDEKSRHPLAVNNDGTVRRKGRA